MPSNFPDCQFLCCVRQCVGVGWWYGWGYGFVSEIRAWVCMLVWLGLVACNMSHWGSGQLPTVPLLMVDGKLMMDVKIRLGVMVSKILKEVGRGRGHVHVTYLYSWSQGLMCYMLCIAVFSSSWLHLCTKLYLLSYMIFCICNQYEVLCGNDVVKTNKVPALNTCWEIEA